jgi:hypothetical protein
VMYALVIFPRKLDRSKIAAITNCNRVFHNETIVAKIVIQSPFS